MMDTPLVSVIIPCYNQAEFLADALYSVQCQTYQNLECIIVNDGSDDETETVAKEWCTKDNRFRYLKKNNGGLSEARNFGISNSTGKYILPLDADDKLNSLYIEKGINVFIKEPKTKLVYCRVEFFGYKNGEWRLKEYNYHEMLKFNLIFCSGIFRRIDYNQTKGYSLDMKGGFEDWDFWLSLLEKEDIVVRIDEVLFYYRVKIKSMITDIDEKRKIELSNLIFAHHHKKYSTEGICAVNLIEENKWLKIQLEKLKLCRKFINFISLLLKPIK